MGHSLSLTTSKALRELILEAEQALQILFAIIRAESVQSGQLICLSSHSKWVLGSKTSLSLRFLIYKMGAKVGRLQRLGEIRDVDITSS